MRKAVANLFGAANDAPAAGPDPRDAMRAVDEAERDELLELFDARKAAEERALECARRLLDEIETEATCQDRICKLVQDRTGKVIDATPNPLTPAGVLDRVRKATGDGE